MIIGTAGHVDHGKTTLIHALTGINTDRLAEERARGLSIELGFAWIDLPCGVRAGIVDVPGHERFIHHMLAGATNMDLALLVVAADEGVRPQTREHLDILTLLEVQRGLVALTKTDLVEPEWLELVEGEVAQSLVGTTLEDVPIIRVSSVTRAGLDDLIAALDRVAREVAPRDLHAPFRLPVDRVFTMAGFGTVVTGTLAAGRVRVGDAADVLPPNLKTRIRTVQVHGDPCDEAIAGSRVALNLAGLSVGEVPRGCVVGAVGAYRPTDRFDARVRVVKDAPKPVKSGMRIRVHLGAADLIGRLTVLDARSMAAGETGLVQIRLEQPGVATRGEHFVLRYFASMQPGRKSAPTLGGGVVLEPYAAFYRARDRAAAVIRLQAAETATPTQLVLDAARDASDLMLDPTTVATRWNLAPETVTTVIDELLREGRLMRPAGAGWVAATQRFSALCDDLLTAVRAYHAQHPLRAGMPVEQARTAAAPALPPRVFQAAGTHVQRDGTLRRVGDRLALADFTVQLTPAQQDTRDAIERAFRDNLFTPPDLQEVLARVSSDGAPGEELARALLEAGVLTDLGEVILHQHALARAAAVATQLLRDGGQMTPAEFRDALGSSRKYVMPLLEYLDRQGITRREGDVRVLGPAAARASG